MNSIGYALAIGAMAGLHISIWGMYKDAPYEGFTFFRFFRSMFLGLILAVPAMFMYRWELNRSGDAIVFFGLVYVMERAVMEFYKTFIRDEDQSKYFIPMQFHIRGRLIPNRWRRLGIGIVYAACVGFVVGIVFFLDRIYPSHRSVLLVLAVGSIGGWISACGGAWKDAPIEGFSLPKFFRSPLLAAGYALILSRFTTELWLQVFPALGFTIATTETYKTFFFPSKPRGKFAGKPIIDPLMLRRRKYWVPVYVGIWFWLIIMGIQAYP